MTRKRAADLLDSVEVLDDEEMASAHKYAAVILRSEVGCTVIDIICRYGYMVIAVLAFILAAELHIIDKYDTQPQYHVEYRYIQSGQSYDSYWLSDAERYIVEQVVMAEAGGEPYCGQVAVAQCIRNACEKDGIRPEEALVKYKYTKNRVEPSDSVKEAVQAVFDRNEKAMNDYILYFYAPRYSDGKWHETQVYAGTIGNHKFFSERS